ncbi:hypothetical protein LCGC14_1407070 [marine sediment metagenome]|uniref:Uncharacterized protein n=1 Tax=marine sediment metagenome TaxID=412755 RepID=A0A0F9KGD5_9ZZZZ
MDIFVKRSKTVEVEVYAWEQDGNVEASHNKEDVPSGSQGDTKIIKFNFRRPGHKDATEIAKEARMQSGNPDDMDVISFQDKILRLLLSDWDCKVSDEDGSIAMNQKNISDLQPNIARAAVAAILDKISI